MRNAIQRAGTIASVLLLCLSLTAQRGIRPAMLQAFDHSGASAVLVDVDSGSLIAAYGAVDRAAAPGSTLKPLVLQTLLDAGTVREHETVHCNGKLLIKGRNLACAHPRDITVLDARQALADSCNTYFATMARRMSSTSLMEGLRAYGLAPAGPATSPDDRALMALGLDGVPTSPRQLTMAYRSLALKLRGQPAGASAVVTSGLLQSVETGMAHAAQTTGIVLGGKTGTAPNAASAHDHGWFAGIVFSGQGAQRVPARVLVVFVPVGNGNDAAMLAQRFLTEYRRNLR